jgi:hypothetical protein
MPRYDLAILINQHWGSPSPFLDRRRKLRNLFIRMRPGIPCIWYQRIHLAPFDFIRWPFHIILPC